MVVALTVATRAVHHILPLILITHEHSDHVAGLQRLATKLNVPVF